MWNAAWSPDRRREVGNPHVVQNYRNDALPGTLAQHGGENSLILLPAPSGFELAPGTRKGQY